MRNRQALTAAQARYDNLTEEDVRPVPMLDQFLESTCGSNWLHEQATILIDGYDSDYVTQEQFRDHLGEFMTSLDWNDAQNKAHIDLIVMAYTGKQGVYTAVRQLIGQYGLEEIAKTLLIKSGAVSKHLLQQAA